MQDEEIQISWSISFQTKDITYSIPSKGAGAKQMYLTNPFIEMHLASK
jgi:hypothetical protein